MRMSMRERARLFALGESPAPVFVEREEGKVAVEPVLVSPGVDASWPMVTRQSERDSCDINILMARYEKTGQLPLAFREAIYADVSQIGDLRESLEQVQLAEEAFAALPAALRGRFSNDPIAFVDFCADPKNEEEMISLGLLPAKPKAAPEVSAEPEAKPPA